MTSLTILEALVSLTAQVTLLIGLAAWLTRKQFLGPDADTCWASLHICILMLTAAAFFLPHLRLITWSDFKPSASLPAANATCLVAGRICAWTWLLGAVAIVAACIGGMFRATSLVRRARADDNIEQFFRRAVPGLATAPKPIEIRVSTEGVSPYCWQFHDPVIVLPSLVRDFPAAEQAAIVRHELAHLRLQHPLHLFFQRLVEAIYWFHPLVWWASRQAAAAREFRCDRDSVHSRVEVADYLRCLLRLIESQLSPPEHLPAGLGFLGDTSLLGRRANVLARSQDLSAKPLKSWRAAIALILVGAMCSSIWLPVNPSASRRANWSPWPTWSTQALGAFGITTRDYEIDGHRFSLHEHRQ